MSHECNYDDIRCYTDDEGKMFVESSSTKFQVNFCPYCGKQVDSRKAASRRFIAHKAEVNLKRLVKKHDPKETDCTKFLICIQDGEIRSYDGCHDNEQGVAHAATLIDTLPSGSDDNRRVMLSIDEVPEDAKGMNEDEKKAKQTISSIS